MKVSSRLGSGSRRKRSGSLRWRRQPRRNPHPHQPLRFFEADAVAIPDDRDVQHEILDEVENLLEAIDQHALARAYVMLAAVDREAIDARVDDAPHIGERLLLRRELANLQASSFLCSGKVLPHYCMCRYTTRSVVQRRCFSFFGRMSDSFFFSLPLATMGCEKSELVHCLSKRSENLELARTVTVKGAPTSAPQVVVANGYCSRVPWMRGMMMPGWKLQTRRGPSTTHLRLESIAELWERRQLSLRH